MQEELKSLQKSLGITFVFVTHDQGEALSMADRVAVFDAGRIQQVGTPAEVYGRPRTRFVADFVGSSNVLAPAVTALFGGRPVWASLRPEALRLGPPEGARITGTVTGARYLGSSTRVVVDVSGDPLAVLIPGGQRVPEAGMRVGLIWEPGALHEMEAA